MSIEGLTTQEKSVILAKLTGRYIPKDPPPHIFSAYSWYFDDGIAPHGEPDLYDTKHMALAWRVLSWASDTAAGDLLDLDTSSRWISAIDYLLMDRWRNSTAAEIQADWLDRVLKLATEAGLVQL